MKKIDTLIDVFKTRLDAFTIGCDSLEDIDKWDKDVYGELDAYCLNEFVSTILRLIMVDGEISEKEVEYVNRNFGFSYDAGSLREVYDNCQDEINSPSFYERIREDIELLRGVNSKLAEEFTELLTLICKIIAASDEILTEEEKIELQRVEGLLEAYSG